MCSLIKHILSPITLATLVLVVVLGGGRSIGEQPKEPRQRIARLIEQLGDADYNVRQRAEEELAKLEFEAFDALRAAETHKDLEIASRAKHLLLRMQANLVRPDDPDEVKRCLAKYRFLRKKERLDRLRVLAGLDHLAGIPALCRLVRFERSEVMSKHAALAIIRTSDKEPPSAELAALLRENLGGSSRPAATWLSTFARFRDARATEPIPKSSLPCSATRSIGCASSATTSRKWPRRCGCCWASPAATPRRRRGWPIGSSSKGRGRC
jgi:hypothetical protein